MTELRHSRDITRFHRDRMILKRKKSPVAEFFNVPYDNWYSKHHFSDCSCSVCKMPRYIRPKFDWRRALYDQDYAALEKKIIQNGW